MIRKRWLYFAESRFSANPIEAMKGGLCARETYSFDLCFDSGERILRRWKAKETAAGERY